MEQKDIYKCLAAMEKHGGDFAKALAFAWRKADRANKLKIETAFEGLFTQYLTLTKAFAQITQ